MLWVDTNPFYSFSHVGAVWFYRLVCLLMKFILIVLYCHGLCKKTAYFKDHSDHNFLVHEKCESLI